MKNENSQANFLYLNRENRWLDFQWQGLELRKDGALQLVSVPRSLAEPAEEVPMSTPNAPAGIAISPDGTIYYTDPSQHSLLKIDPCDRTLAPVPCLGGEGDEPTQFCQPRGVLFHLLRQAIFVVDSGNHRIQIFDPQSLQLIGIWGQPDPASTPAPDTAPGRFDTPWTLAGDDKGNVYVVDFGNRRVQKFDLRGNVMPEFWQTVQQEVAQHAAPATERQASVLTQPSDIAVGKIGEATEIYILDRNTHAVYVFDPQGHYLRSLALHCFGSELQQPMGLAIARQALYVGDDRQRRIFKFKLDGTFVGAARGYEGAIASLAIDLHGNILVHSGSSLSPIPLALEGAYIQQGFLWGGPFSNPSNRQEQWHLLKAQVSPLLPGAHLQLFVYTTTTNTPPPNPTDRFVTPWSPFPLDAVEGIFPGTPSEQVWVGVEFSSEGLASPVLFQIGLEFDHETYLQYLPAIYQNNLESRQFLNRFLSLFESLFNEVEGKIENLSLLFDPATVPIEFLPWLAGWLAIDLDRNWSPEKQRQAIARGFEMYAQRGTAAGLRQTLHFFAGVDARIEEPIAHAAWWSLPAAPETVPRAAQEAIGQSSLLGFTTMLVAAETQGAVVGTTAVLDQSHLIAQAEFGTPLFADLAHRFSVQVYRGQVDSEEKLTLIRSLLDREKPAHTDYHLCIIEPHLRIGFQSRVGIDTIVAGSPPPSRLQQPHTLNNDFVLGGTSPGRIGDRSQVGQTTRLGEGTVEA